MNRKIVLIVSKPFYLALSVLYLKDNSKMSILSLHYVVRKKIYIIIRDFITKTEFHSWPLNNVSSDKNSSVTLQSALST